MGQLVELPGDNLMSVAQAQRELGLSERTVRQYITEGQLDRVKFMNGRVAVRAHQVRALRDRRCAELGISSYAV